MKAAVLDEFEEECIEDSGTQGPPGALAHRGSPELRLGQFPRLAQFDMQ